MDYRLALLLQTHQGLKLDPADLTRVIALADGAHARDALDAIADAGARRYLRARDWVGEAARLFERGARFGVRWSYLGRDDYPAGWYGLSCRPALFSYRGEPVWRDWPALAVVGSRTPSVDSIRWLQREFTRVLERKPLAVVSGGARGVDQWAHRLALAAGRPTVCVLPSGLLNAYPPGTDELWDEVVAGGGAVLSTFPADEAMRRHSFPIRNRWITGLSPVTFVVEANHRSGSYLTARLAEQEERTICTLPVSANAAQGLANLQLIADGHVMVRDADDLTLLLNRKVFGGLGPGAAERVQGETEED